mmetsp:Transcript_27244/g.63507  ORF Transcript_27244/g.63507 Transcript_27244/m.63507 type:complete len:227 (-) Transcript_27244:1073-1753(-)
MCVLLQGLRDACTRLRQFNPQLLHVSHICVQKVRHWNLTVLTARSIITATNCNEGMRLCYGDDEHVLPKSFLGPHLVRMDLHEDVLLLAAHFLQHFGRQGHQVPSIPHIMLLRTAIQSFHEQRHCSREGGRGQAHRSSLYHHSACAQTSRLKAKARRSSRPHQSFAQSAAQSRPMSSAIAGDDRRHRRLWGHRLGPSPFVPLWLLCCFLLANKPAVQLHELMIRRS